MKKGFANIGLIVALLIIAGLVGYGLMRKYNITHTTETSYQEKMLACHAIPMGSTKVVVDTDRLFINLPKEFYPKDITSDFQTDGHATAGWVSNAGEPGEAFGATPECWSTYIAFQGNGEVELRVKSMVKDTPDYFVFFTVTPTPQQLQLLKSTLNNDNSNGGTKTNHTNVYKNTTLKFQMTFPAGWYLPETSDGDPHAYNCPSYDCEMALEVQLARYFADKSFNEIFLELKNSEQGPTELTNFISGARVIKSNAPGPAEGWVYEYDIIFYAQKNGFVIFTNNEELEKTILPSLKLLI